MQCSPIAEHLGEPHVVAGGGNESAAAGEQGCGPFPPVTPVVHEDLARIGVPDMVGQQPRYLVLGNGKERVPHVERTEQPFAQEHIERLAADPLDGRTDHVGRNAVVPFRARLELERQLRQAPGEAVEVVSPERGDFVVETVHRIFFGIEAIGKPRRMRQQVPHGHGLFRGHALTVLAEHLQFLEFGQKRHHRIIKLEGAVLVEHHRRDRRDRLGHGKDAKQRVLRERPVIFHTTPAHSRHMHDPALAGDHRQHAGELAFIDELLCGSGQSLKCLGRHANALRRRDRYLGGAECRCHEHGNGDRQGRFHRCCFPEGEVERTGRPRPRAHSMQTGRRGARAIGSSALCP